MPNLLTLYKHNKIKRTLAIILTLSLFLSICPIFLPAAKAATAQSLAAQISGISGLSATVSPASPNVVSVSGTASGVSSTISLIIDTNVTINWGANLTGNTASGRYLLNLSGGGTFNLSASNTITNGSGIITVTGDGTSVIIGGTLNTPGTGNGISINVAANDVSVNVTGSITNSGTNSAINVTAGVRGNRINVSGGTVTSTPAGYAINDGGTSLTANNTQITVTGGAVTAGSACAIKSTGADSVVTITGGVVSNSATVNSNPVIYMNGGTIDNVIVGGDGVVRASDNNLGYGIQTTGNVTIGGNAEVRATSGRAINLVGMDSHAIVNSGTVSATTGVAICTATTNPASVANAKITVNGGLVYTAPGDPGVEHGSGRAIYSTGAKNTVTINGGWVYTEHNNAEAIYVSGVDSSVNMNGGWVTAKEHFAIEAYSGASVTISGGFVFAYGIEPLSYRTGATIHTSAIGAISDTLITVDSYGVVAVWNRELWATPPWNGLPYIVEEVDHLATHASLPATDVYWQNRGNVSDGGIYYSSGPNIGFFPLAEVMVEPPSHFVTVINGTGTGQYAVASPVSISANQPPDGMEFERWDVRPAGIVIANAGSITSFIMPDQHVTIEAVYRESLYTLTVTNGSGGGRYRAGTPVTIMAATAQPDQMFTHWTTGSGSFSNALSPNTVFTMPSSDATVTASYVEIKYYTFAITTGTVYASTAAPREDSGLTYYPAGTVLSIRWAHGAPYANYEFSGWRIVYGGGSFADATSYFTTFIMPATDTSIAAEPPTYRGTVPHTLTVINGNTNGVIAQYSATAMTTIPITADPAPEGYEFTGWTIATGTSVFADSGAMSTRFRMPAVDATIVANYAPIDYSLIVEYGQITSGENSERFNFGSVTSLTAVSPDTTTLVQYRFDGWTVSGGGSFDDASAQTTTFTMPNNSVVVTAHWTPLYRLDVHEGSATGGPHFEAGSPVLITAYTVAFPLKFGGWQSQGGGTFIDASEEKTYYIMPPNNSIVSAFSIDTSSGDIYSLTVVGGTIGSASDNQGDFSAGEYVGISLNRDLVPPGQVFTRWTSYTDAGSNNLNRGTIVNATSPTTQFIMPDQDVTVTANYAPAFILRIDIGDGNGPIYEGHFAAGAIIELPAAPAQNPSGHVFARWTAIDGTFVNERTLSTTFIMPGRDVTVTATYYNPLPPPLPTSPDRPGGGFSGDDFRGPGLVRDSDGADVPSEDPGRQTLEIHRHIAFIQGIGDDLFDPDASINRAQVAQMFFNLLVEAGIEITASFPDVSTDAWYEIAVDVLATLGVLEGYPDGGFHPNDYITRAEFAAIAARFAKALNIPAARLHSLRFTDVPETHWAFSYIDDAADFGWIMGVGDGLFEPDRSITRAEAVAIVNRMLGRHPDREYIDNHERLIRFADVQQTHWAYYEILEAANTHDETTQDGEEHWEETNP